LPLCLATASLSARRSDGTGRFDGRRKLGDCPRRRAAAGAPESHQGALGGNGCLDARRIVGNHCGHGRVQGAGDLDGVMVVARLVPVQDQTKAVRRTAEDSAQASKQRRRASQSNDISPGDHEYPVRRFKRCAVSRANRGARVEIRADVRDHEALVTCELAQEMPNTVRPDIGREARAGNACQDNPSWSRSVK